MNKYKTEPDEPLDVKHGCWNDEYNKTIAGRGLTKREYFSALAFQALIPCYHQQTISLEDLGHDAVITADALIKALNEST